MSRIAQIAPVVLGVMLSGCGVTPIAPVGDGGTFIALGGDFGGYRSWTSLTIEDGAASGSTHVAGKRTVYVNQLPPPGATSFPVGTIIVKHTEADGKLFARAKRSMTFNGKGAVGWEWFELEDTTTPGVVKIAWRGVGPPVGEKYGGDPNAGCNLCHKVNVANDYVLTPGLMLSAVPDAGTDEAADAETIEAGTETDADDAHE
jgi:hypothetical protein